MKPFFRWLGWVAIACVALELFFLTRIAVMVAVDPQSTAFQRSEAWRISRQEGVHWQQQWTPYAKISDNLKRAVIASEDSDFVNHDGVDWEAMEKAWQRNAHAEEDSARRAQVAKGRAKFRAPRIVGGSTITQQIAKNLLLSGERNMLRKGQEFVLALMLEALLSKQRILEIYLNNVEWGEGVFGAEAAAQRYFHVNANQLTAPQAARLAVMLPRPRYFEQRPTSAYVTGRASTIVARMQSAELP